MYPVLLPTCTVAKGCKIDETLSTVGGGDICRTETLKHEMVRWLMNCKGFGGRRPWPRTVEFNLGYANIS
jgi:hypothetical protein